MVAVATALLAATGGVAHAADSRTDQQLQQELNALKSRMQEFDVMKARVQQLEKELQTNSENAATAKAQAAEAKKQADETAAKSASAKKVLDKLAKGQLQIGRTNVFLNGWVEASFGRREHNEIAGPSNSSLSTPFPYQQQYHTNEFRFGPPQTRFGINTVSDVTDDLVLKTKLEFDLLSGSNAASTGDNQSWTPRVRHAWAEIDDAPLGLHVLGGQAYSLTIPNGNNVNADGSPSPNLGWMMLPGTEVTSTPDDGMLAGLGSTRNVQIRVVKEVAPTAAVAFSMENQRMKWGGDHLAGTGAPTNVPLTSNTQFSSSSQFTTMSTLPDFVAKAAYDPSPNYHFEAFGILRQYKDVSFAPAYSGAGTVVTGGGGVSTYIKAVPGLLDVQLGAGYGSFGSQIDQVIPDATFDAKGKPVPVYDEYVYGELIGHPVKNLDLYLQAGVEQGMKAGVSGTTTQTAYGYGNPYGSGSASGNSACFVLNSTTCTQDTKQVWNVSFTPVWRVLNNNAYGHLDFMPQVQYWERELFADQHGHSAHASNWAVDAAFRYWPF